MKRNRFLLAAASLAAVVVIGAMASVASAQTARVSGWLPNVGELAAANELAMGDMWKFDCPLGGQFRVVVDTRNDQDNVFAAPGNSCVDPIVYVLDANGVVIAAGDDEVACTYTPFATWTAPPGCGAISGVCCPLVSWTACPLSLENDLFIVVRDYGENTPPLLRCNGGGYELKLRVKDQFGQLVEVEEMDLGGGPERDLEFLEGSRRYTEELPLLNDENVPF